MATERVGDMTLEELKAIIREIVYEEFVKLGIVVEGEEEMWKKPLSELTGAEILLRERRRRELL